MRGHARNFQICFADVLDADHFWNRPAPATVVTRYFNLTTPATAKLTINGVSYRGGRLRAELLDADTNVVINGYSLNESIPFEGDSVAAVLQWGSAAETSNRTTNRGGGGGGGSGQLPSAVKIRFELVKTRLYGFSFQ